MDLHLLFGGSRGLLEGGEKRNLINVIIFVLFYFLVTTSALINAGVPNIIAGGLSGLSMRSNAESINFTSKSGVSVKDSLESVELVSTEAKSSGFFRWNVIDLLSFFNQFRNEELFAPLALTNSRDNVFDLALRTESSIKFNSHFSENESVLELLPANGALNLTYTIKAQSSKPENNVFLVSYKIPMIMSRSLQFEVALPTFDNFFNFVYTSKNKNVHSAIDGVANYISDIPQVVSQFNSSNTSIEVFSPMQDAHENTRYLLKLLMTIGISAWAIREAFKFTGTFQQLPDNANDEFTGIDEIANQEIEAEEAEEALSEADEDKVEDEVEDETNEILPEVEASDEDAEAEEALEGQPDEESDAEDDLEAEEEDSEDEEAQAEAESGAEAESETESEDEAEPEAEDESEAEAEAEDEEVEDEFLNEENEAENSEENSSSDSSEGSESESESSESDEEKYEAPRYTEGEEEKIRLAAMRANAAIIARQEEKLQSLERKKTKRSKRSNGETGLEKLEAAKARARNEMQARLEEARSRLQVTNMSNRCKCITKNNTRCRLTCAEGSDVCAVHMRSPCKKFVS